ncbi:NACHT domain-containing protein [Aliarcobacter butzleri]
MDSSILTNILTKSAIEKSLPFFNDIKDATLHYLNDGLLDYYHNTLNKYAEIKTMLHRQPTNFYDIYYPTKLEAHNDTIITDSTKELFKNKNFITIIGDAGSGKSTLIRHLFITSIIESYKAPIFISLRELNKDDSNLEVYIRETILRSKLGQSNNHLNKLLSSGDFLFFLDGYDEINSSIQQDVISNLQIFIDKYSSNKYILTSRPYTNIEYFSNFYNYRISDLSLEDRIGFIKKQIKDTVLSEKIIESIKDNKKEYLESFLKNPLLLTLYIMTYSKNSSIPNEKFIFYRRVFDVLYTEHDSATKIGFEREIKTKLNQESLEEILKQFSYYSFFEDNFAFTKDYINSLLNKIKYNKINIFNFNNNDFITDMKLTIGLWVEDSGIFSFAHRSMQEYFAALSITKINNIKIKKNIYTKLTSITLNHGSFNLANIVSLCYEMDKANMIKYYSLPILEKVKKLFSNKDGTLNYNLSFMNDGFSLTNFSITADLPIIIGLRILPHETVNDILGSFSRVFIAANHHKDFNKFIKIKERSSNKVDKYYSLPKNNFVNQEYINFLREIGIEEQIVNTLKRINTIENDLRNHLNKIENYENSLTDIFN